MTPLLAICLACGKQFDPIDFLTASPIQGCWIYIDRANDQTMKGCVESPKDLGVIWTAFESQLMGFTN